MISFPLSTSMKNQLCQLQDLFRKRFTIISLNAGLLFLLMLTLSFKLKADAPRAKGYYIDNDGNKHEVTIIVATPLFSDKVSIAGHQNGFTHIDKKGKKITITPGEAQEFGYTYKNEKYVFRFLTDHMSGGSFLGIKHLGNFHYVLLDGACQVYQYEVPYTNANGGTGHNTEFILVKSKEDVYHTNKTLNNLGAGNTRSSNLEEFFADCPDLVAKIKAKEFKKMDDKWIKIAEFYNKNCQSGGSVSEDSESE